MKHFYTLFIMVLSFATHGQSIIGQWVTYDDKTNEKKAIIAIYKTNNLYFAKIIESYVSDRNALCDTCKE